MQYSGFPGILSDVRHIELDIDNQTLLEECRRGDREAMSILYTRFAPRMIHVISRYVNDRDSAQDILHDGFIAAFTRLDTLREAEKIEFWLATIMKNLSLKYLQAQTVTSILEEIPETIEEPEIDNILDFDTLESLIRKLPEGYQKVFRLAVLENKSHKEISEILGIAPNSSSSQLFHAKLRLRELIKDYQLRAGLLSLLLLLASSGFLFFYRQNNIMPGSDRLAADSMPKKKISKPGNDSQSAKEDSSEKISVSHSIVKSPSTSVPITVCQPISITSTVIPSDNDVKEDSISTERSESDKKRNISEDIDETNYEDRLFTDLPDKIAKDKGWSAGISFAPGMLSFNNSTDEYFANDPSYSNPGITNPGTDPKPDDEAPSPAKLPPLPNDIVSSLRSAPRRHHLPITFSLTAEKHISSWLGIESGIAYSYLHTDFERYKEPSTCHWHYLEIPLKANLYAYSSQHIKLYGSLGGKVSIPVYSYAQMAPSSNIQSGTFRSKVVWSAGASIGAAFRLSNHLDIFIEPSLNYHFPQECTIPNIWTDDEPWSISIPIGLRFNW